jgi:small subunit ribosomal protein S24e
VDVSHPGKAATPKAEVQKLVAALMKADAGCVVVYSFKTAFGGGRSSGFGLVYDSEEALKKFEPKYRLVRRGLATKKTRTRKQWKDVKRKQKRTWGTGRRASARAQKKAAAS